jgi:hypothetical protein
MSKMKNQIIYGDKETLERLYDEYVRIIGREGKLEEGKLTIFALPRKRRGKKVK